MKKYENTNFRVAYPEIVGIIVFACLLAAAVFFYKSYTDVKDLFNIERTEVDFIIQAPSMEQVTEISNLSHIDRIVPYYYRSVDVSADKGKVSSHLFIVEGADDIPYTTLSKELLLKKGPGNGVNALYVTDDFAKSAGVKAGDSIKISIDGTEVDFTIEGIYKTDHRHVGGTLIAVKTADIENAMKRARYGGAFIASNNLSESGSYFANEYKPQGDIRSREEFETDDAYQTYLETRDQSDTTKEAFVIADYARELSRRNSGKLLRNLILVIALAIAAYIILALIMIVRTNNYTKTNVPRDIKDNFTIGQETRMYQKYFATLCLLMLLINVAVTAVSYLLGWMELVSIVNIAEIGGTLFVAIILGSVATRKLKERFLIENKKYEEKTRKAQGAASQKQ